LFLAAVPATLSAAAAAPVHAQGGSAELPLAQSNRVYLAEIEHRGQVLTLRAFPAFAAAIRSNDAARLAQFLAPTFRGEICHPEQGDGPSNEVLRVRRILAETSPKPQGTTVDAAGFVKFLLGLRDRFQPGVKTGLAVMSLQPVKREFVETGPYRGSCELRFLGTLTAGGLGELTLKLEFDFRTIPDVDVVLTETGWVQSFRVVELRDATATHALFAEVAKERGIDPGLFQENWAMLPARRSVVTGGAYVADVDDDGWQDVLVTDQKGLFLFRGLPGGRFEEVSEQAGLPHTLRGVINAAFGDFDNDGWPDLLLHTRVFRNLGGFRFQEITPRTRFHFEGVSGFTVGDYDKDGRLDLYVTRLNSAQTERQARNSWIDGPGGPGNQLWRNLGDWRFEEVSAQARAQAGRRSCFTAAWLDANNDTWPDLYVINEFGGGILLVNRGDGTFREQPLLDDAGDFGSMGMAVGDFNNDGHVDVYTANMYSKAGRRIMENLPDGSYPPDIFAKMKRFVTGSELYRNLGGLKFERVGLALRVHAVGWAYGAAFCDLDNDGFLDLYGTAGFMSVTKEEPDG
jgi:hypothetical protein